MHYHRRVRHELHTNSASHARQMTSRWQAVRRLFAILGRRRGLAMLPLLAQVRTRCGSGEKGPYPMRTFLTLVDRHSACSRKWMDQRCVNGPQTQRPLHPAVQVLGWLFECERTQVSRSFALQKQVRWWERGQRRRILSVDASGLGPRLLVRRIRSFLSFRLKP